ncbi:MAG: class I tRNA ligase family protein [Candidatus Woesearchaeota archaeon]
MAEFKSIQDKWQKRWAEGKIFKATEDKHKKKFYCLEMFPYPSAAFLHMGHVKNFSIGDTIARFKRMQGYNVLYPMGYDSFGLPAENAAKKAGVHPKEYAENSIATITKYFQELGLSYDWDRTLATHEPRYYKWNQYFFIKFYEKGLVYRKKAKVNFCNACNTVLANEEVEKGKCWRCENDVVEKDLDQWFFKTTAYADQLLEDIEKLKWPDKLKTIQENWIGKSYGTLVDFKLENGEPFPIFTTRPDTIFGVTFMVIALNHPRLKGLIRGTPYEKSVNDFIEDVRKAELAEDNDFLEKSGVFTGLYAINPLNNEKVPIYAGNFVVADYATGMIMAVPAHDQRDYEFAVKYDIPIKQVIVPFYVKTDGPDAVRHDKETIHRDSVYGIVKHWKEDKYLCLDWKKFNWKSFIIGGVEKDETPEDAILREVKEETGYQDIKSIKRVSIEVFSKFFAHHKDVNRYARYIPFLVELGSDEFIQPSPEEVKNHEAVWLHKKDVANFLNLENNTLIWDMYIKGGRAYTDDGVLSHSAQFNGMNNREAIDHITEFIEKSNMGKKTVQYKLKDWLISRQRYWGTPIPMMHCNNCGIVPVPLDELPLLLPDDVTFGQTGNPLLTSKSFIHCRCPKCHGQASRETDTMGGFMDSSWYFLRYCSPDRDDVPFDKDAVKYWMPVDQYVGGIEHAVGHLIYSRFFTKVLRDMGMLDIDEPFNALFNQGIVYKDGHKMSKSYGNIVTQVEIAEKYGIDTARMFILFVAAPDKEMEWSDQGMEGTYKFLTRIHRLYEEKTNSLSDVKDKYLLSKQNIIIREITRDIEEFRLNTAIVKLMDFVNYIYDIKDNVSKKVFDDTLNTLSLLLNPFAPHLSEECHELSGGKGFASLSRWPICDESKIDMRLHYQESVVESTVRDIRSVLELAKIETPKEIELIISESWKYEFYIKVKELVNSGMRNVGELSKHIMNSELKKHGQEIMKILPKLVDKLPEQILDQHTENDTFLESRVDIGEEFNCEVKIILAEHSKEAKARQAAPGKPAIIVR